MSSSSSSSGTGPTPGSATGSYDLYTLDLDRESERLRTQALLTWPKEARNLGWYGLRDGMAALELGSGPGYVTGQLLDLLPHSLITTVEVAPEMIERAAAYLRGRGEGRLRAIEGSVLQTGLPDASVDFAIARFLFQHLADPVAAAREALRVLKPGGKLVLVDVDDAMWGLLDPPRPDLDAIDSLYAEAQAGRGGDRFIGRRFIRILREAGFVNADMDLVLFHSDTLGADARDILRAMFTSDDLAQFVKTGHLSEQQLAELKAADEAWLNGPAPLTLYPLFMAVGEKPGAVGVTS
jgi:ubiquinone/menaquinone biosynthesis C-methylase UbiE